MLRSSARFGPAFLVMFTIFALFLLGTTGALAAQDRPLVMLDPGHGGDDAGVVEGDMVEKDLVLQIAFAMAAELVAGGYDVGFTRTGDYAVPWDERRSRAEEAGASLLIMLHLNRSDDPNRHGAEIYAHLDDEASDRAAHAVAAALEESGSEVLVEARPWPFLQSPTVPTVMIELAFMTHPVERRLVRSHDFHRELGRAMATAADRLVR